MNKTIRLNCFCIKIELEENEKEKIGGNITSGLKEKCPYCGQKDCYFDCDQSTSPDFLETAEEAKERKEYNLMMDAIESLILAHALAGIDVTTPAYKEGIETAVDACANHV